MGRAAFPIINISREMTIDSEGAGRWRGQPGSLNVKKVLEPTMAMAWMVSAAHPLRGMCGGDDASPYSNHFEVGTPNEYEVALTARAQLPAGAVIAYQHGGGAGFGPPLLRDPEAVKEDVLDEIVSVAARAREIRRRVDRLRWRSTTSQVDRRRDERDLRKKMSGSESGAA